MINLKKTTAVILAAIMTMTMGITAFADENNESTSSGSSEVIRIQKELTAYNPETVVVNEPTATYTYEIKAGQAGAELEDENEIQAATKAGVEMENVVLTSQTSAEAKNTTTTLSYSANGENKLNASAAGTANKKWIDIDFSNVNFGAAGVYRYEIHESASAYTSNGIKEGTTEHVRYLDVYVKDAAEQSEKIDQPSDWDVYGFVLFAAEEAEGETTEQSAGYKTEGFVAHKDENDSSNNKTADEYYTFNLIVSKTVMNDAYIKTTHHKFPFTLTLQNDTVTADVLPIMNVNGNAEQDTLAAGTITGEWTAKIADGASIQYVGIPAGTTIDITETNDVTGAVYRVNVAGADNELEDKNIYTGSSSDAAVVAATAGQKVEANRNVAFTNTLQQISPTGVVLRVAPYILMLAAGVVLLVIARRRRTAGEA